MTVFIVLSRLPLPQPGAEKGGMDSRQESQRSTAPHSAEVPTGPYDRSQAQLFAVQKTVDTYLSDPKGNHWSSASLGSKYEMYL